GIVGDDVAQRFDPGPLRLGEVAEHVRVHQFLGARVADTNANPPVVVAYMGRDRAQAVMARDAAAGLHSDLRRGQIDLIVKDYDRPTPDLEKIPPLRTRPPGLVHVCSRKQQDSAFAADRTSRRDALKAPPPRPDAVAPGNGFDRHEADIVAVAGKAR